MLRTAAAGPNHIRYARSLSRIFETNNEVVVNCIGHAAALAAKLLFREMRRDEMWHIVHPLNLNLFPAKCGQVCVPSFSSRRSARASRAVTHRVALPARIEITARRLYFFVELRSIILTSCAFRHVTSLLSHSPLHEGAQQPLQHSHASCKFASQTTCRSCSEGPCSPRPYRASQYPVIGDMPSRVRSSSSCIDPSSS